MKIKILFLCCVILSVNLARAMDEPPPSCTTDEQKEEYTQRQAVLLSADVAKIKAHMEKYHIDLNTPCMNMWYSRKHHPTYPIEWVITKTYDTRCIVALLQAGVPAQGYDDYSPLMDLICRDLNCNDCIQVLYNAGADPKKIVRTRFFSEQVSPIDYVRLRKSEIVTPIWYKPQQRKLDRLTDLETILSSPRQPLSTIPVIVHPVATTGLQDESGPAQPKIKSWKPSHVIIGMMASAVAIFGLKKLYDWYYVSDEDGDAQDDQQETQAEETL